MISVRTLGPLEVRVHGGDPPDELMWRKNLALLLYLARAPAHRCTRDHAIGLLWPDKDQGAARQSLREAIRHLRRAVGDGQLRTEHDQLELAAGAVALDVDQFDRLVAEEDWAGAAALSRGEFVEGFGLPDASLFEDWLLAERGHWRRRMMDALLRHAEARLAAGDLLGADEPARRALQLDTTSQGALRTLMRRLALAGDRAGALALYGQFLKRAAEEGVAPEPETTALAARVRSQREWKLPSNVAARRVPLFGREKELAQILAHWRTVRAGQLALMMIEAPAGGGKTRMAEEVMARTALDGGVCVATRAVSADQQQAMSGIVALTRGGLLAAPGIAAASAGALAAIAREASEWAERFPAAAQAPNAMPLAAGVIDVLKAASVEQPLLLVLDDAQWLDDASLGVLETMVRDLRAAPVLILLATTPEPAGPPPRLTALRAAVGRNAPGSVARLAAFDEAALEALVRWSFPKYSEDQISRVSRRIAADSAGIPLLAVEICHAITHGLDVDSKSGVWPRPLKTLDDTRPGDLPETIVGAIRVGFNALSPSAAAVLKAAAVLGDRVSAKRIGRAAGLAGTALHAALDELEWRRWLVADARGYSFVGRIVREVVDQDFVLEGERLRILHA